MRSKAVTAATLMAGVSLASSATAARAQSFQQIYDFPGGKHGSKPEAGLLAFRGKLFGTTSQGGSKNCSGGCGTVFWVNLPTGTARVLYALFQGGSDGYFPTSPLINVGGLLYGTIQFGGVPKSGIVFSIDPTTGAEKRSCPEPWCRNGATEQGWLLDQAANAGRLTVRSSLSGAMVSSVIWRAR